MNASSILSAVSPKAAQPSSAAAAWTQPTDSAEQRFADVLRAAQDDASKAATGTEKADQDNGELKEKFTEFVGQTLFGQLFKAMRESVGEPAYFHGGRTEEIFQQQLDQVLVERMTKAQGGRLAETMYDLQFGKDESPSSFLAEA